MLTFNALVIALHLFSIINKFALTVIFSLQKENKVFFRHLAIIIFGPIPLLVCNMLSWMKVGNYGWLVVLNYIASVTIYVAMLSFLHVIFNVKRKLKNPFISCLLVFLYLPYIVSFLYYLFFMSSLEQQDFINANFNTGQNLLFDFLNSYIFLCTLITSSLIVYFVYRVKKHRDLYQKSKDFGIRYKFSIKICITLLVATLLVIVCYTIFGPLHSDLIWLPIISNCQIFYILYLVFESKIFAIHDRYSIVYNGFFKNFHKLEEISSSPEDNLKEEISAFLKAEKPYLNENFSINDLADGLNKPTHAVSSCINNEMNESFPSLIGKYRSTEFKKKLLDSKYDHLSIEGIGKLCGYKSRSVMYYQFKESTGLTPAQFVKSNKVKIVAD